MLLTQNLVVIFHKNSSIPYNVLLFKIDILSNSKLVHLYSITQSSTQRVPIDLNIHLRDIVLQTSNFKWNSNLISCFKVICLKFAFGGCKICFLIILRKIATGVIIKLEVLFYQKFILGIAIIADILFMKNPLI